MHEAYRLIDEIKSQENKFQLLKILIEAIAPHHPKSDQEAIAPCCLNLFEIQHDCMKRFILLTCLSTLLLPAVATGTTPLPRPNSQGNYSGNISHQRWVVVDNDPQGLNCRWSSAMPREWYSPAVAHTLPERNVLNWSVVRRFQVGSILVANPTPAGFTVMTDTRHQPWLKVSIGENDQICLARANSRFIRPVR